ncbi:MAG TPA: ribose-phosphate diphosphokinase, partial [Albitalea sp.]
MTACLIAWPGADACADRLAAKLHAPRCRLDSRRFPDGERYLRVMDAVAGRDAVVVARLRDPDPQLPGLMFLADALRELGAKRVGLVAPYLPYMRQDVRFRPGEAVSAKSLAKWISAQYDWLATVDPHLHRVATLDALYAIPTAVVPSAAAVALWVQGHVTRPHIVGPDAESGQWVAQVAAFLGCGHTVLAKSRHGDREVEFEMPDASALRGHTPVLVDDIISTGHTMAGAVRQLLAAGVAAPVCVAVHGVFAEGAEELLQRAGAARVVTCNTLPHPTNAIDLTEA